MKLNVDAKWSCSLYKTLDYIQLKDGLDKAIISRDDAAGFRLDTFIYTQATSRVNDKNRFCK